MANAETPPALSIAAKLRAVLTEKNLSQRELARRLAGEGADSKKVDQERRQVSRWLSGTLPTETSARRLAAALDVESETFVLTRRAVADLADDLDRRLARLEEAVAELQGSRRGRRARGGGGT